MTLPPLLAPWAAELNVFPEEVAASLGPMILRLSAALGPFASPAAQGEGEPDGYAGLGTRGHYDRLVPSEWLLADELPDEFDRRAAMNEHFFWQFARNEPSASRSSYVLFDAGPSQIGAPRLAHIALLIVLIRRARTVRATFGWGVLQDAQRRLFPGFSESEFWSLLGARTASEPSAEDARAWKEHLAKQYLPEEVWIAGGSRAVAVAPVSWSLVRIEEPLEIELRHLKLRIETSAARRELVLELPPEAESLRLLRDPFQNKTVPPVQEAQVCTGGIAAASNLVFDHLGKYLFSRSESDNLIIYPLNGLSRHPAPKARRFGLSRATPTAVGRLGKATVAVIEQPEGLAVRPIEGGKSPLLGLYRNTYGPMLGNQSLCTLIRGKSDSQILLLSDDGRCLELSNRASAGAPPDLVASCYESHVLAIALLQNQAAILRRRDESAILLTHMMPRSFRAVGFPLAYPPRRGFFGCCRGMMSAACTDSEGTWTILTMGRPNPAVIQAIGKNVVGFVVDKSFASFRLLVLENDRQTISLFDSNNSEPLFTAPSPLASVTTSYMRMYLAYATITGDVGIFSLNTKKVICSFDAGDGR